MRRTGSRRQPAFTRALSGECRPALLLSPCLSLRFRYFHGAGIVRLQSCGPFSMPRIPRQMGTRAYSASRPIRRHQHLATWRPVVVDDHPLRAESEGRFPAAAVLRIAYRTLAFSSRQSHLDRRSLQSRRGPGLRSGRTIIPPQPKLLPHLWIQLLVERDHRAHSN